MGPRDFRENGWMRGRGNSGLKWWAGRDERTGLLQAPERWTHYSPAEDSDPHYQQFTVVVGNKTQRNSRHDTSCAKIPPAKIPPSPPPHSASSTIVPPLATTTPPPPPFSKPPPPFCPPSNGQDLGVQYWTDQIPIHTIFNIAHYYHHSDYN